MADDMTGAADADRGRIRGSLLRLLAAGAETFEREVGVLARGIARGEFGRGVHVCGLLALGSICRNDCTYCGLRVSRAGVPRFRLSLDDVRAATDRVRQSGLDRVFFISGEDPGLGVDTLIAMAAHARDLGLHVTMGVGLLPASVLRELGDAGVRCYSLKFETANRALFARVKPTADFDERMACIRSVRPAGLELGSGNIVGLEGQTLDDLLQDLLLMEELAIDWAPVVPYLPAPGTPMAETTPMGDVALTLRVLSLIRVLLPRSLITAGQPSQGSKLGFADPAGNRAALQAGANILFVDVTPGSARTGFAITPGRVLDGLAPIQDLLDGMGLHRITGAS